MSCVLPIGLIPAKIPCSMPESLHLQKLIPVLKNRMLLVFVYLMRFGAYCHKWFLISIYKVILVIKRKVVSENFVALPSFTVPI